MDYTVKVVLLIVIFSLISGGAGYYLGSLSKPTPKATQSITTPKAQASPNAATSSAGFNPFSGATGSATTNPFDSSYQNPFSNVKGAATGYVNPFDEFVKRPAGSYNYLPNLR